MLAVVIAVILGLQFYYSNKAQRELLERMDQLTQSLNLATESYYQDVLRTLQKREQAIIQLKREQRDSAEFDDEEEFTLLSITEKPDTALGKSGISPSKHMVDLKRKFLKKSNQDTLIWNEEHEEITIISADSGSTQNNHVTRNFKIYTQPQDTETKVVKVWKIIHNSSDDSPSVIIEDVHIDVGSVRKSGIDSIKTMNMAEKFSRVHEKSPLLSFRVPDLSQPDAPRIIHYNYNPAQLRQVLIDTRNRNILIAVALFVIALVAMYLITDRFLKPITALKHSFDEVINGDLKALVPTSTRDEIGELTDAFNHMVLEMRKNREKELLLKRKERLASVGQLAAGIAHEIKNPLNAINLTIGHLKDKVISENDEKTFKYIRTVQEEIQRLDKLVNNFLNFVRSENLQKSNVDIHKLLMDVINLYRRELEKQQVVIENQTTGSFMLLVDVERFKTVLSNLILNAIQAMPGGGKLTIQTNPENRQIIMKDSGIGINESDLENIFNLFYTSKSSGTGLGLPTAYKIVKEHGGDITIKSQPGKGTNVTVQL